MDAALQRAVDTFLASKRIAVAGVSRDSRQAANAVYRRLRDSGKSVVGTNPRATTVEGDPCYPDLRSAPAPIEAVFVSVPQAQVMGVVRECIDLGIRQVWMHRSFGRGSVDREAVRLGRENGLTVIDGACPMMFCAPVDPAHRCMRAILGWFGGLPRGV